MHYSVVHEKTLSDLINQVNMKCEEGFKPMGGIQAMPHIGYIQAIFAEGPDVEIKLNLPSDVLIYPPKHTKKKAKKKP